MEKFIVVEKVKKIYHGPEGGVQALRQIDLTVDEGEFVAIMGPSGSGKSTLLSIIGAMNPPSEGRLLVDEIDIYGLRQEKLADFRHEYLGFVFQELQLIPYLTAIENVLLPLAISNNISSKEKWQLAQEVLEKIGLGDKARRLPSQLSGGEQERVAIARAIVSDPPILLADEPTGSLDSKTGEEIMKLFQILNQEEQRTIIMVTHNREAAQFAQRVILIRDGEIIGEERLKT